MSTLRETINDLSASLREPPDEILLEVGAGGELLVAHLRVGVASLLLLLPLVNLMTGGTLHESIAGLAGAGLALALSLLWRRLAQRPRRVEGLAILTAASDVTMVTLVLVLLSMESPVALVNSAVVWCCYALAIVATALRHDVRVTLLAGLLAVVQTALLWAAVVTVVDEPLVSAVYGTVSTATQIQRLVLLVAITMVTAMVVFRAQRLTQFSATDGLTGLPNRSYLNTRVPQQIRDARAQGHTVSLALIDLDNFRHINAELGHLAGDRALRHAVKVLRNELGREEPMIRAGGEEFVLLLRLPIGAAWERMEVLRRKLEAEPFLPGPGVEPRRLTLSAGLASCPQDANDLSGLMKRADQRLQVAKQAGRNRVVVRDEG
ncbi:GGDEF domain-containing protein [Arenimonas alkanexedens]